MKFRATAKHVTWVCLLAAGLTVSDEARAEDADTPGSGVRSAEKAAVLKEYAGSFFNKHCVACHGGKSPKADLALDKIEALPAVSEDHDRWEAILMMVRDRQMPPEDRPQPSEKELQAFVEWLQAALDDIDCSEQRNPGRVTLRRLNRSEYDNTIRDLVGVDFHPAEDFPVDDSASGFDNIGEVLSISPILMEKYVAAAEQVMQKAVADEEVRKKLIDRRPEKDGTAEKCARDVLRRFASRAYRRPVRDEELGRLVELATRAGEKLGYEEGVALAMQAVLVSPNFLFLVEVNGNDPDGDGIFELNPYELATRLSYFLWSSMPDERLFALAADGKLYEEQVLADEVRRMLRDPKSEALVENFAGQWLQLRLLSRMEPDREKYSAFDDSLRASMIRETELFFRTIVQEDRNVLEFLDADYTFLNGRLAKHYGVEGVDGDEFRRVALSDDRRGGVLTHASILTLTSNPTRTSPVKRGKWILENILGTPPPPPPPDAGELSEEEGAELLGSLRERTEQHRANPSCAVCHTRMDPLGFGFENFDGIGAWREKDGRFAIDASGELPGGLSFDGPAELREILVTEKRDPFVRCLAEKLLTYALGRAIEPYDRCAVQGIEEHVRRNDYRFSSVIIAIVNSEPFRMRSTQGDEL